MRNINHILVIHGFNSGKGSKSDILEKAFPEYQIHSPQLQNGPINDLAILQSYLNRYSDIHVVGTSLGGFYGLYLALMNQHRDDLSFYLINPSYTPYDYFSKKLNQKFKNYKTNTEFIVNENFINQLKTTQTYIHERIKNVIYNIYWFFGTKDTELDHQPLKNILYSFNKPVNIFESEQDHRYENIEQVINQIKQNSVI
jgi:predicted esterase YcpF (UPF0227 family)